MRANRAKPEPQSILLLPPGLEQIERFAEALNTEEFVMRIPLPDGVLELPASYQDERRELRRLVHAWRDSGPNVAKLLSTDPVLSQERFSIRGTIVPTKRNCAQLVCVPQVETRNIGGPIVIALGLFLTFLLNPANVFLCGPCLHCDKYFVRKGARRRTYCSNICGRKHTSRKTIRRQRGRDREKKLERIQISIKRFENLKRSRVSSKWDAWVARDAGVTKNWITRAVKRGDIAPPERSL